MNVLDECHDVENMEPYNYESVLKQPRIAESPSSSESNYNGPLEEHTRLGLLANLQEYLTH